MRYPAYFFLLIGIFLSQAELVRADNGGYDVGNGGDGTVISILGKARLISQRWSTVNAECASHLKLKAEDFARTVQRAHVETQDAPLSLMENGRRVRKDAINFPATGRVVFNRLRYEASDSKDQLVVHEMLWLAGIDDSNYSESNLIVSLTSLSVCQAPNTGAEPPLSANGLPSDLVPRLVATDDSARLYLADDKAAKIFVFDLQANQALPPIEIRAVPQTLVYSKALKRLYIGYQEGRITKVELGQHVLTEQPYTIIYDRDFLITSVGSDLYVGVTRDPTGLTRRYLFDRNGRNELRPRTNMEPPADEVRALESDADQTTVYYFPPYSSSYLIRFEVKNGRIVSLRDPAWDQHAAAGFVAASKGLVITGLGTIFEGPLMRELATVDTDLEGAIWYGRRLATVKKSDSGFAFKIWSADYKSEQKTLDFEGEFLRLALHGSDAVLIYTDRNHRLQINPISF